MKYTLTRFKPSGKWYDDTEVTFPADIRPYANPHDVLRAYYGEDVNKWTGSMHLVMMETPWGYPVMVPATQTYYPNF